MRHMGRTHGISISWLHEQYMTGSYRLDYEQSATMRADIFTKSFNLSDLWHHACELVNLTGLDNIEAIVARGDLPPTIPQGGSANKRGEWSFNPDGSGTFTRYETAAKRLRVPYKIGPDLDEIHTRETYDANTKELIDVTHRFDQTKIRDVELPPPVPRATRTVFHFASLPRQLPPEAQAQYNAISQ